jgi:hypothetical protein
MKKFIIVLCSIIIILIMLPTFLAINFEHTLLKPRFYKEILNSNDTYSKFLKTDPQFFSSEIKKISSEDESNKEDDANWDRLVALMQKMSPQALEQGVGAALDSISAGILEGKSESIEVNLSQIKLSLLSQNLSKEEIEFVNSIEDNYSVSTPGESKMVSSALSFAKKAIWPIWAFCSLLLVLIWLLEPGWRERVRTTGIVALVFAAVVVAAPALISTIPTPSVAPEMKTLVADLFRSAQGKISGMLFREIAIIGGIGVIMIVVSFFIQKTRIAEKVTKVSNPKVD